MKSNKVIMAALGALLLVVGCRTQEPYAPDGFASEGRLAIGRLSIGGSGAASYTRVHTPGAGWEADDVIRVTATAASGSNLTAYYKYKEDGTWFQFDAADGPTMPTDTYPLYVDDIDRTHPVRIDCWAGGAYDLAEGDLSVYTSQGLGGNYHRNDHLACLDARIDMAEVGGVVCGNLSGNLVHQRVDVVVRVLSDATHPLKLAPNGTIDGSATLLDFVLPSGNSVGAAGAVVHSWLANHAASTAPDEAGKSVTTFRAYLRLSDLPGASAVQTDSHGSYVTVAPNSALGTFTYATSVGGVKLIGDGKLPLLYSVVSNSAVVRVGNRLTLTVDFTHLNNLALSATIGDWEDVDGGDLPTSPGIARGDGSRPLDATVFNASRTTWIVSGGGTPELDSIVVTNVRNALKAIYNPWNDAAGDWGDSYAGSTFVELTLPDVTKLPIWVINDEIYGAFFAHEQLRTINLPAATTIGESAFSDCAALTSINAPNAITIGDAAFFGCSALTSINLPEAITIGDAAFQNCGALTSITLPAATTIGEYAFCNCSALPSVNLPAATTIRENAFRGCDALTSVIAPKATTIGYNAFGGCSALTSINLPAAITIGDDAFNSCAALTSINLPAATSVGENAFQDCAALTSINLPAATTVGERAFQDCAALTSINLPAATFIQRYAFSSCAALTSANLPVLPDIEEFLFEYCDALTSVIAPKATTIGRFVFTNCDALTSINLPAATTIGGYAFQGCFALTSINLPAATTIGGYAFQNCGALTNLHLTAVGNITLSDTEGGAFEDFYASDKCNLYLNENKRNTSTGLPKVDATGLKWGELNWKKITFVK